MGSPSLTTDFSDSPLPQPSLCCFYHTEIAPSKRRKTVHYKVDHFSHLLFMLQTHTRGHLVTVHSRATERKLMHLCDMLPSPDTAAKSPVRWNGSWAAILAWNFDNVDGKRKRVWESHANSELSWTLDKIKHVVHWYSCSASEILLLYRVPEWVRERWKHVRRRVYFREKSQVLLRRRLMAIFFWWSLKLWSITTLT